MRVWKVLGWIVVIGIVVGVIIWLSLLPKPRPIIYRVTYLSANETPLPKEFIRIDIGRHRNYPTYLPLIDPNTGDEFDLPIEAIKRVKFGTLPDRIVRSWPSRFENREKVPKIRVVVEYLNGASKTYLTYATYWAYLYDRQGKKIALHLCRVKEIQLQKKEK